MSKKNIIFEYVSRRIGSILKQSDTSGGKATLANLRRGIGKTPGEIPELWGTFLTELNSDLLGKNGYPSEAEWAIYISLTLFALHQQGHSESMNKEKYSVGKSASLLMNENNDDERNRILRRFAPVVTAKDMKELSHHLRGMIKLFNAKSIPLDYAMLAGDIYDFQFDDSRKRVQMKWGQDFYYNEKQD